MGTSNGQSLLYFEDMPPLFLPVCGNQKQVLLLGCDGSSKGSWSKKIISMLPLFLCGSRKERNHWFCFLRPIRGFGISFERNAYLWRWRLFSCLCQSSVSFVHFVELAMWVASVKVGLFVARNSLAFFETVWRIRVPSPEASSTSPTTTEASSTGFNAL